MKPFNQNKLKIGITMRVTNAMGYDEPRDSIAHDWNKYLLSIIPDAQWIFLPNIEEKVLEYIQKWELNAFIFTGGENIDASSKRDITEGFVWEYARLNNLPVIGVCRGMQFIYTKLGGAVRAQNQQFIAVHKAKRHLIALSDGQTREVNSYHENGLIEKVLSEIEVTSRCSIDNTIESFSGKNILCMMWHPEREEEYDSNDFNMIQTSLKYKKTHL